MSDTISLDWIGATLRSMQAEQRTIRAENQLIRSTLNEAVTLIMQRIGNFEAYVDIRFDQAVARIEAKLGVVETRMDEILARLPPA
jgi:hypothetical protein